MLTIFNNLSEVDYEATLPLLSVTITLSLLLPQIAWQLQFIMQYHCKTFKKQ